MSWLHEHRVVRGFVVAAASAALAILIGLGLLRDRIDSPLLIGHAGETRDLVRHPRYPLRWRGVETVEIRT